MLLPLVCLGLTAIALPLQGQQVLNGVAAVVNKDLITFKQVRELTAPKERESMDTLRGTALVEKIKEVRTAAVNDLIDRSLIIQDFKAKGFSIPEHFVDEELENIIRDRFHGDRPAFLRKLEEEGRSLAEFREFLRDSMVVEQMRKHETAGTTSPAEAKQKEDAWLQKLRRKAYIKIY
ncbi:MAG: SurA N-terminal domain-containing protein [Chthoniobacter sp.]